jgi:hypothetical protein
MAELNTKPTPYPEVNKVLNQLLPRVQSVLGDQFIGMYLYGSLAYGGFDRDSDVDFVVITAEEIPDRLFSALDELHISIARLDSWCATQLEGSYLPLHALRQFDPVRALHLHIDRGRDERLHRMLIEDPLLSRAWWGGWVLMRAVLWEDAVTLAGPDIITLIEPVTPGELEEANLATLEGWVKPILQDLAILKNSGYQSYFVLTLCRILYTLKYGKIVSKQVAASWAQTTLGEPWRTLIDRAWLGRQYPGEEASPENIQGTLDFARYTLEFTGLNNGSTNDQRKGKNNEADPSQLP